MRSKCVTKGNNKRFLHLNMVGNPTISDQKTGRKYIMYDTETADELCSLLNNIEKTKDVIKQDNLLLRADYDELAEWAAEIAKRNVELDEEIIKLKKELKK